MLQKFKITIYALMVGLVLVLVFPRQKAALCNTQEACEAAATRQGLQLGDADYPFAGAYATKGCYAHPGDGNGVVAYYGTGGTQEQMAEVPSAPKYRIETAGACNLDNMINTAPDRALHEVTNMRMTVDQRPDH